MIHFTRGHFKQAKEKIPIGYGSAMKKYKCNDCRKPIEKGHLYIRTLAFPDVKRFGRLREVDAGRAGRTVRVFLHIRCSTSKRVVEAVNRVCTTLGIE